MASEGVNHAITACLEDFSALETSEAYVAALRSGRYEEASRLARIMLSYAQLRSVFAGKLDLSDVWPQLTDCAVSSGWPNMARLQAVFREDSGSKNSSPVLQSVVAMS